MYIFKNFPGKTPGPPTQGEAASNAGRDGGWRVRGGEREGEGGEGKGWEQWRI
jgi:hypothetical protein